MMKGLNDVLIKFSDEVLKSAKRHLGGRKIGKNKNYGVASGNLKRSLSYKIRVQGDTIKEITFGAKGSAAKYAKYTHWGVNGTRKNQKSFMSFKNDNPSKNQRLAITKWMKQKGVALRSKDGRFIKRTDSNINSAAYAISKAIKRKGIVGLRYYEKAFTAVFKRFSPKIGEAVAEQMVEMMKLKLGNITMKK